MAILTEAEVHAELATMYRAKQALADLNRTIETQATAIMERARQDVVALRASYATQRATLQATFAASQQRLEEGS